MVIGIDASRAFLRRRTGIEEYSYQLIKHLRAELRDARVVLYVRAGQMIDFDLPETWVVRALWSPRLWTQVRLSLELLCHPVDALLVPAHIVPVIHPQRTIVVVHGLEYEFCPEAYSWWERWYMRGSIWYSVWAASDVVCVSENTRQDVMRLYGVAKEKIALIGEGYARDEMLGKRSESEEVGQGRGNMDHEVEETQGTSDAARAPRSGLLAFAEPYFLFIGRIEERKNVRRIIEAFDVFKQETGATHRLVLVGKPGYGYERVERHRSQAKSREDIIELGYVSEEEKWQLLQGAEAFLFPTLYEGFGIPVLEAQSVGVPVITSLTSSLPEVSGGISVRSDHAAADLGEHARRTSARADVGAALLVDPEDVDAIATAMRQLTSDDVLKQSLVAKGYANVKRYSWEGCAREVVKLSVKN